MFTDLFFPAKAKISLLVVIAAFSASISLSQSTYYVRNGNQITKVENSDPTKVNVKEWQVLLFKHGAAKTMGTQWGLIDGKSASDVMAKLKRQQDFEIRYNKWAGKGAVQDEVFTNFNPLGPIAVIENNSQGQQANNKNSADWQEKLSKVQNMYEEVKGYYDDYQQIVEIIEDPKPQTPFDNVGNVFKEYSDNLKEAYQRVTKLRDQLQRGTNLLMDQINTNINEINRHLSIVKEKSAIIKQKMNIQTARKNQPDNATSSKTTKSAAKQSSAADFEKYSEELTNAMANMDPNDPDATYKQIKKISKLLAKSIGDDPDSDSDMKKLAAILMKIADEEDDDKLSEYLQQMIELLGNLDK